MSIGVRWATLLLLLGSGCRVGESGPLVGTPGRAALAAALHGVRPFELGLAGSAPATCAPADTTGVACRVPAWVVARLQRVAATAARLDPRDAIWTTSLIDLVVGADGAALDRATEALVALDAVGPPDALLRSDASVALAIRAARGGDPTDLLRATELAASAVALNPSDDVSRFNLAVLLDRLHLVDEANRHFALAAQRPTPWGREAGLRSARPPGECSLTGGDSAVGRLGRADRAPCGERGPVASMPQWLELAADSAASPAALARAAAGSAARGDSIATWVLADMSTLRAGSVATVGRAFRLFREGETALGADRLAVAELRFREVVRLLAADGHQAGSRRGIAAVADWALNRRASIALYRADFLTADLLHRRLVARWDIGGGRALAGQGHWGLALSAFRRGDLVRAGTEYRDAIAALDDAGDRTEAAGLRTQLMEVLETLGLHRQALETGLSGLGELRGTVGAARRQALLAFGYSAERLGYRATALAAQRSMLADTRAGGGWTDRAEAFLRLARALGGLDSLSEARAAIDSAVAAVDRIEDDTLIVPRLRADIGEVEGVLGTSEPDSATLAAADHAVGYYQARGLVGKLPGALRSRSRLRLAAGDSSAGIVDLRAAIEWQTNLLTAPMPPPLRASSLAASESLIRDLVAVTFARGDTAEALRIAERARGGPGALPMVAGATLAYLVLEDQTLVWFLAPARLEAVSISMGRVQLGRAVGRLHAAVRLGDQDLANELASELHGRLIGPFANDIAGSLDLTLVTDGLLQRVPFAMLRSPVTGRYLVEDHVLRHASWVGKPLPADDPGRRSLLVADASRFDRRQFSDLSELPAAASEVAAILASHPGAKVAEARAASRDGLVQMLPRFDAVHFIGHARSVEADEAQSHLVTNAPGRPGAGPEENILTGADIARLDLRRLRLVVLSSCGTIPRSGLPLAAVGSLGRAFLGAGAGGVVSSIWEVDDRAAGALMRRFHGLAPFTDPAGALRAAQKALVGTTSPRWWASFRYEY